MCQFAQAHFCLTSSPSVQTFFTSRLRKVYSICLSGFGGYILRAGLHVGRPSYSREKSSEIPALFDVSSNQSIIRGCFLLTLVHQVWKGGSVSAIQFRRRLTKQRTMRELPVVGLGKHNLEMRGMAPKSSAGGRTLVCRLP